MYLFMYFFFFSNNHPLPLTDPHHQDQLQHFPPMQTLDTTDVKDVNISFQIAATSTGIL